MAIDIDLWSPTLQYRAPLGEYTSCELVLRHNQIGEAIVHLGIASPKTSHLISRGARLTAELNVPGYSSQLFTGRLSEAHAKGPSQSGEWEARFEGDLSLLYGMLAYPVPGSPLSDQSAEAEFVVTGPLETVFKTFVRANATRFQNPPVIVAPDQRRGPTVTVKGRMQTIATLFTAEFDKAGMGMWVEQTVGGLLVDVYVTAAYPYTLSEIGGTVDGFTLDVTGPDATVAVMSPGSDSRTYLQVEASTPQEVAWGRRIETYSESGSNEAEMRQAGLELLDEATPTWGIAVEVSAGDTFNLGRNVWLGDHVTVELAGEEPVTQPLREVTVRSDMGLDDHGFPAWSVSPQVGETSNASTRLYKTVTRIADKLNGRSR